MKRYLTFLSIMITVYLLASCSETNNTSLNPNGDSELAILMREMYNDLEIIKKNLSSEDLKSFKIKHDKILTAKGTEPEKVNSDTYKAFSEIYLSVIESFNKGEDKIMAYKQIVNSCQSCHQSLCPGPLVKINKLVVK